MPTKPTKTAGKKSVARKPKTARPKTPSRPLPDDASAFLAALARGADPLAAARAANACAAIAVTRRGPATAPTLGELAQLLD